MATYTWKGFSLNEAMSGALVGKPTTAPQEGGTIDENIDDISRVAGNLVLTDKSTGYKVVINGVTVYIKTDGKVSSSVPSGVYAADTQMYIATAQIEEVTGSDIGRTRSQEEGYSQTVSLTTMEPRDNFAIQILSAMLVHAGNPETFDDANITMYSSAAYRWAQGMLNAAANARHGQSTSASTNITVNTNDLQSNTERLLYNISNSLEQGVIIKGSNALGAEPVHTKITSMPNVTVANLDNIAEDLDKIAEAYTIPTISESISIKTGIFQQKYIRFEFVSYMAYSNISVFLELNVKEGETATTRKVGYILQKGSVVAQMALDAAVTEITSITTKTVRGKGENDPNTYTLIADS